MTNSLKSLIIDEDGKHVLTKIRKTKKGTVSKESDHNELVSEFNVSFSGESMKTKLELYNIKNSECQEKFKLYTSNTNMLSSVFDSKDNINLLKQRFPKKLDVLETKVKKYVPKPEIPRLPCSMRRVTFSLIEK